jgi:glycosyltransferase involved in cell wall biosynthesis
MKKLDIAYVTHVAFPDVVGDPFGSLELARKMSERGHKATIITWNKATPSLNRIDYIDNVQIWRLAGINFKFNGYITEYPFTPSMSSILDIINPDIIHAHSHLFLTTYQAVKYCINQKKPSVVSVRGVMAKRQYLINLSQKIYLYTLASWIFKKATVVHCLTKSDAMEIMKLGCPAKKIKIIPNPVDVEFFAPQPKFEEDNIVVWIGRFVPEKGLDILIKVTREVVKYNKNVRFLLVGDGPFITRVKYLIKKYNIENNILLTGAVSRWYVSRILARASVFILPSLKEGLPKALLEAMSSGKAVVASDIPGIREVIMNGKSGILVKPYDYLGFAKAVLDLIEDREFRHKLGATARYYILKNYSWEKILKELENIYSSLTNMHDTNLLTQTRYP